MKQLFGKATCLIVLASCSVASAQFVNEDFDSYPIGNIDGLGPWVDFGGVNLTEVSADYARSGSHSMKMTVSDIVPNPDPNGAIGYGSDVFLDMPARVRSGQYMISYWIYMPSDFNGSNYAYFSEGLIGAGDFDLGIELIAGGEAETFTSFDGSKSGNLPLIRDEWVEAKQIIDFDANAVRITYGGDLLYEGKWDIDQPADGDFPQFRGVNFWVQDTLNDEIPTGSMYIDDVRFVPEPRLGLAPLLGLMSLVATSRRRRK